MYIKDGSINGEMERLVNEWNVQCNGERADNATHLGEASELVTDVRLYASPLELNKILLAKLYGLENSVLPLLNADIDGQRQGYALVAKAETPPNTDLALAIEHMKNHQLKECVRRDVRRI
ncbi:hypothetical protein SPFM20_00155 [Salmonella phage SPFM20]|nr:hypothetical protein SPFM20_00155 [Salmonella phage SPFM20]